MIEKESCLVKMSSKGEKEKKDMGEKGKRTFEIFVERRFSSLSR